MEEVRSEGQSVRGKGWVKFDDDSGGGGGQDMGGHADNENNETPGSLEVYDCPVLY